jgi:hypothetical protein
MFLVNTRQVSMQVSLMRAWVVPLPDQAHVEAIRGDLPEGTPRRLELWRIQRTLRTGTPGDPLSLQLASGFLETHCRLDRGVVVTTASSYRPDLTCRSRALRHHDKMLDMSSMKWQPQ